MKARQLIFSLRRLDMKNLKILKVSKFLEAWTTVICITNYIRLFHSHYIQISQQ